MANFMDRLRSSFNILKDPDYKVALTEAQTITSYQPISSQNRLSYDTTKAILAPIMTRISVDVANIPMYHVLVDEFEQFKEKKTSELNDRLSIRANIDQSGVAFIQDAVLNMLETGSVALVPVEVGANPNTGHFDILSIRAAPITQWFNESVEVSVYNELTGNRVEKTLPKSFVAIAYNPLYYVMNEPNSTLSRLIDRLALLDRADGKLFSPQLDLIIQLPYTLKTDRLIEAAEARISAMVTQLEESKYGIAYAGANEKITQLNRPVTNDLIQTVGDLTESLHAQLGLTPSIFAGSATQEELVAYNNRTISPIVTALTDAMVGTFFTRTAIRQGHRVMAFQNLFKMAPLTEIADASDKLTRNEIMTSNEVRAEIGLPPSEDPDADVLRNKNLNKPVDAEPKPETGASDEESVENKETIDA